MPVGWNIEYGGLPGYSYLNNNISVRNSRLQAGEPFGYGSIARQYDFSKTSKVTVEYDGNLAATGTGDQGTSTSLMRQWPYSDGPIAGMGAQNGFAGISSAPLYSLFVMQSQDYIGGAVNFSYGEPLASVPVVGNYHFKNTYQDGLLSMAVTAIGAPETTIFQQTLAAPNFSLKTMSFLSLNVGNSNGALSFIDNVQITETKIAPRSPKNFGLFIGVQDSNTYLQRRPMDGDGMASTLYNSFVSKGNTAEKLTANLLFNGAITKEDIKAKLDTIKAQMLPGDTFVFYSNAHGASVLEPFTGKGSEYLRLGSGQSGELKDSDLYQLLQEFDSDGKFRKEVFLDACHSGGFWGPVDPYEVGASNLSSLKNITFFASAPEDQVMYYDILGHGYYSQALDKAFQIGLDQFTSTSLSEYVSQETRNLIRQSIFDQNYAEYPNPVFFEGAFGDPVLMDPNLSNPFQASSADFNVALLLAESTIPEPSTLLLFVISGVAFGILRRRKQPFGAQRISCAIS